MEPKSLTAAKLHPESCCNGCSKINEDCNFVMKSTDKPKKKSKTLSPIIIIKCAGKEK